jgi:hypothetical protein
MTLSIRFPLPRIFHSPRRGIGSTDARQKERNNEEKYNEDEIVGGQEIDGYDGSCQQGVRTSLGKIYPRTRSGEGIVTIFGFFHEISENVHIKHSIR